MKLIYLVIKIVIFLIFLLIALGNTQTVPFFYLPGQQLDLPLIVVLFGAFLIGAVFGVLAMFGRLLRLRSENNRLRREVAKSARVTEKDLAVPATTVPAHTAAAQPALQNKGGNGN